MSISLLKGATITRSVVSQPALWNSVRFASQTSKAVTQADVVNVVNVDVVSGAPEALSERSVRIFSPTKPATQSGKNGTRHWRIDFDILEDGNRWENPLIGWASSSDYQQALQIKFNSKDAAIKFAQKQGWSYFVQEPKPVKFVKKAYADNYKYCPGKLRLIKTK
ncbi:ETC complex I subunit conserved region-domain-containing protein [Cunninghamella echinulata]|nr:ETC complex I subunit conserved region-domain-containing protein [Cunninghamella echinulata]